MIKAKIKDNKGKVEITGSMSEKDLLFESFGLLTSVCGAVVEGLEEKYGIRSVLAFRRLFTDPEFIKEVILLESKEKSELLDNLTEDAPKYERD